MCVCVCMYVCMYVYNCIYMCVYVCVYMCMCMCMYMYMHMCMHLCMHACMHACMHVCIVMQWNGMEWNVCMYVYSTYTHIIPYRLSFFFPASVLVPSFSSWIREVQDLDPSDQIHQCQCHQWVLFHDVPWKSWKSAQLRMEWYMNDTWMICEWYFWLYKL